MRTNPLKQGILIENHTPIGTVTREMVRARALELAVINGHSGPELSTADLDRARRELTGESDEQEAAMESIAETDGWDPVHGSIGQRIETSSNDDEDEEGRTDSERLVEAGIAEAEHDLILKASTPHGADDGQKD